MLNPFLNEILTAYGCTLDAITACHDRDLRRHLAAEHLAAYRSLRSYLWHVAPTTGRLDFPTLVIAANHDGDVSFSFPGAKRRTEPCPN